MTRLSKMACSVRRAIVMGAIATAASGVVAIQAQQAPPAQAAPAGSEQLQTVVVTGSMIKRSNFDTPSPIQIITAQDLQQSGYTSVADVLRNLAANGQGTLTQSFTQAFAGGASGIALRGLTVGATLTLIDSQRMVGYPLSDDGERNFVDISQIPFTAIDRIDVLKDGASAEYGSDAIAGVVNVILKKTFTGVQVTGDVGSSQKNDGTTEHGGALFGIGNLAADGYNAYLAIDIRHQDKILVANRKGDYTNLDWRPEGGQNTTPGVQNATTPFPASVTGYLVNPTTPNSSGVYPNGLPQFAFLPGCTAAGFAASQCTFNWPGLELQPATSDVDILTKITKTLGENWTATFTGSLFSATAEQIGPSFVGTGYPIGFFNVGIGPGVNPFVSPNPPLVLTVPANYPGNPYGQAAPLIYNFPELGIFRDSFVSNTWRAVLDVQGSALGWDIDAAAGAMYAAVDQHVFDTINPVALQSALNNGYQIGAAANGQLAQSLFQIPGQVRDTQTLDIVNVGAQRHLAELPGGPLALGVGVQYNRRVLNALAPPAVAAGITNGNNAYSLGAQDNEAVFAELQAHIWKPLEVDGAVRYDNYNQYGGDTTPGFKLKYTPFDWVSLRGTYGKGFRAPNIPEAGSSGLAFLAATIPDPVLCPSPGPAQNTTPGNFPSQCAVQLIGVQQANKLLKPEKSTNYTFGVVLTPIEQVKLSVDYYDIKIDQDIISSFELGGLATLAGVALPPGQLIRSSPVTLPFVNASGQTVNAQTPVGLILYQPFPYVNGSSDNTNGIDVELQTKWDLGPAGRLTTDFNWTHLIVFDLSGFGVTYHLVGTHGPSGISGDTGNPQDRAVLSLGWDFHSFGATATVNYISSFSVIDPSAGQPTCQIALASNFSSEYGSKFPTGSPDTSLCKVSAFTDLDLYAHYKISNSWDIHGSVLNAFDKGPPLDVVTYGGGGAAAYDAALHQAGAVGRFFNLGFTFNY